ncbi:DUF485 domain-containing protein [Streptomyces sp. A7024]|uniref:DUF485 domain-containing protein n=1 Tax=Streptomyces coryli TaxID=1128680 RepID=A0A6G4TWP7_9ACTN|nr:DUF485 domain-containing protein [Streptomyces coryli]
MSAPPPGSIPKQPGPGRYTAVQQSQEFGALRRAYRSFSFPLTVAFVVWYLAYVLLSVFATDAMGTKVAGNINVAFVLGVLQFVTTFLIAWFYARHAAAKIDPKAEAIKNRVESENDAVERDA